MQVSIPFFKLNIIQLRLNWKANISLSFAADSKKIVIKNELFINKQGIQIKTLCS